MRKTRVAYHYAVTTPRARCTLRVPASPRRQQCRLTCRSGGSHDELVLFAYLIMCIVYYYYYALQLASSVACVLILVAIA